MNTIPTVDDEGDETSGGLAPLDRRYLHVNIDVTEQCNLECVHCPYVTVRATTADRRTMAPEMVSRLETEVFPYAERASLSSFHESLMAPDRLFEVMDAAGRAGVTNIDMHTNGLLLDGPKSRRLVEGMNLLMLSLEGATPASYAASRVGGTLDRFIRGAELLVAAREECQARDRVRLRLTSCMSRRNIHEASLIVELAARIGIEWVEMRLARIADIAELRADEQLCHSPLEAEAHFLGAAERARSLGIRLDLPPTLAEIRAGDRPRPRFTNCLYPWNTVQISPRGGLIPCCLWHGRDLLDQWDERPFQDVWNGEGFRRLRRELETSTLSRAACRNCEVHFNLADPRYWQEFKFAP